MGAAILTPATSSLPAGRDVALALVTLALVTLITHTIASVVTKDFHPVLFRQGPRRKVGFVKSRGAFVRHVAGSGVEE